jgi:hypothetical protein
VENPWNLFSGCSAPSHIINLLNVIAIRATARRRARHGAVKQHQKIRSKFAQYRPALAVAEQS